MLCGRSSVEEKRGRKPNGQIEKREKREKRGKGNFHLNF
jgi:hypothetical protein